MFMNAMLISCSFNKLFNSHNQIQFLFLYFEPFLKIYFNTLSLRFDGVFCKFEGFQFLKEGQCVWEEYIIAIISRRYFVW